MTNQALLDIDKILATHGEMRLRNNFQPSPQLQPINATYLLRKEEFRILSVQCLLKFHWQVP
jgi:hypothetical protein